jgi:hypothetical protein
MATHIKADVNGYVQTSGGEGLINEEQLSSTA